MATSNSHLAYDDLRAALDRAMASKKGILLYETTPGKLIHLRQRLYKVKSLEKAKSRKIYQPDDPRYDCTPWDKLAIETNEVFLQSKNPDKLNTSEYYIKLFVRTSDALIIKEIE